jgi:hypothetical protein
VHPDDIRALVLAADLGFPRRTLRIITLPGYRVPDYFLVDLYA